MVVAQRTHAPGVVEEWLLPHSARNRRASKPLPSQITQDVFSHRPFQLTHYSPALCTQIQRKTNYSMDHFGARREDAQYNTGRTAMAHGMVWAGRRLFPSSVALRIFTSAGASFFSTCASQ